jgi:hypothetical protein
VCPPNTDVLNGPARRLLIRQLYDGTCNPPPGRRAIVIADRCELAAASGRFPRALVIQSHGYEFCFLRCSALPMFSRGGRGGLTEGCAATSTAYRAVTEEQDDTILWLLAAMQGAGGAHTVVLRGKAVNYAIAGQGAPGLTVGEWKQTQAPRMDRDVTDLIDNQKIPVYVVEEDLAERGIASDELVSGVKLLSRRVLPRLFAEYEVVSHW